MEVILQYWEESERGWGLRPDGCSLHIDARSHEDYVDMIYRDRTFYHSVPQEYDRIVGNPVKVIVIESLYERVLTKKTIRLSEVETNNLIKLKEITTKNDLN
jgi:hypothetical protein